MLMRFATTDAPQPDLSTTFTIYGGPAAGKKTLFKALCRTNIPCATVDEDLCPSAGPIHPEHRRSGWITMKNRRVKPAELRSILMRSGEMEPEQFLGTSQGFRNPIAADCLGEISHCVIFLDLPYQTMMDRMLKDLDNLNYASQKLSFFHEVTAQWFKQFRESPPPHVFFIDATRPKEEVAARVQCILERRIHCMRYGSFPGPGDLTPPEQYDGIHHAST